MEMKVKRQRDWGKIKGIECAVGVTKEFFLETIAELHILRPRATRTTIFVGLRAVELDNEYTISERTRESWQASRLGVSWGDAHGTGRVHSRAKKPQKVGTFEILLVHDTRFDAFDRLVDEGLIERQDLSGFGTMR